MLDPGCTVLVFRPARGHGSTQTSGIVVTSLSAGRCGKGWLEYLRSSRCPRGTVDALTLLLTDRNWTSHPHTYVAVRRWARINWKLASAFLLPAFRVSGAGLGRVQASAAEAFQIKRDKCITERLELVDDTLADVRIRK